MTENLDYINIYEDYQYYFPSLVPFFECIHSLYDNSCKYAAAQAWIQKSEKSGEVVVTKHRDRKSPEEAQKERIHGKDNNRYRMVIQLTPSNGPHRDRQKKTCFAVATGGGVGNSVPVVDVYSISHSFLLLHSEVNGKEPIVEHCDENNINNKQYLNHCVKEGSHSISLVCEFTLPPQISLNQAAETISQCYGEWEQMMCYYDYKLAEPESMDNSNEGKAAKLYHRSKDLTLNHLELLQEFIAAAHGRFPRQFVIHPDMSEEQMKENQLYHFWMNRKQWEHHCDKEDFVELTRKYDERKILLIMDNIDQLQEFIAAAHGRFPRQFVIHPDMSEEQMKENQLHHFWDKRTRWEHHCNKEDFVELKRMWNSKKRTSTTN